MREFVSNFKFIFKKGNRRYIGVTILLIALFIVFMVPVYYLVIITFKTPEEAALHPMALPTSWNFSSYGEALEKMNYFNALKNTIFIAGMTVLINISAASMASYALARHRSKLNSFIFMLFVSGMMIPFQMGLSSLFKLMSDLKLVNTPWAVILVNASGSLISSIFMMKSFISSSVPIEIEEAARIDGAGVLGIFFQIVLPLMKPVIATMSIIVMLGAWNDFLNPLLFLMEDKKYVLLQQLSKNIGQFSVDWNSMFPMLVLSVLPLTLVFIFLQRYIISGVVAGAVKG